MKDEALYTLKQNIKENVEKYNDKTSNWIKDVTGIEENFITFKKGRFSKVADFRDSNKDTKYKIFESYSLDDIKNIRKGNNVRGELVWAENFEEEKKKDVLEKKETIMWLNNLLQASSSKIDKRIIKNELLSYQREFPELIEIF